MRWWRASGPATGEARLGGAVLEGDLLNEVPEDSRPALPSSQHMAGDAGDDFRDLCAALSGPGGLSAPAEDGEESADDSGDPRPLLSSLQTRSYSSSSLGEKSITFSGSVVLTINNISGAGMLTLPRVFQASGWVIPSLIFVVICVSSSLAATFLTDAMARIPGNAQFDLRVEFACVFGEFFGPGMKHVAQSMLMICFYSQIIAGIVAAAQVVDGLVVFFNPWSTTYAVQMLPSVKFVSWTAPDYVPNTPKEACSDGDEVPFMNGESGMIITLGYLLVCLFLVPFSFGTLDDNIAGQKLSFLLLLCFSTVFIAQFMQEGLDLARVPAFGQSYRDMLGSIIFNYAFIVMVPSWLNEKRSEVSVNRTVWTATVTSTILYLAVGILGGLAYDAVEGNFLNSLASHCNPPVTRLAAFLFAIVCVGLSVPIFCIMVRYNLIVDGLCSDGWAVILSVALPFAVSWVFYHGDAFNTVVSWSGQLNNGPVNFILPLVVALRAVNLTISRIQQNRGLGRSSSSRRHQHQVGDTASDAVRAGTGGRSPGHASLPGRHEKESERERDRRRERSIGARGLSPMPRGEGVAAGGGRPTAQRLDLAAQDGAWGPSSPETMAGGVAGGSEKGVEADGRIGVGEGSRDVLGGGRDLTRWARMREWLCSCQSRLGPWACFSCIGLGVPRRSLRTVISPLPLCLLVLSPHFHKPPISPFPGLRARYFCLYHTIPSSQWYQ